VRTLLRTLLLTTAALSAAVAVYLVLTLPPSSLQLTGTRPQNMATGAYHIHTSRSDGTGTVDAVAEAAAKAGLQFVVLTDHGDGTIAAEPPAYRHGVLVIDALEIGTTDGHVVALNMARPTPYPLAGRGRDVVDDVHRWGGVAIAAHPDSPKPELRWRGMNTPVDGIEWINADSEWRDERPARLLATATRSIFRPAESVAALFSRPTRTLQRWDAILRSRAAVGLAAVDAHARISWREDEEPRQRTALAWPTYQTLFETLAQTVVLDRPLSGDAPSDAARVLAALAGGQSFSIVRALAWPATLQFTANGPAGTVVMGESVAVAGGAMSSIALSARVPEAAGARVALMRDGREIAAGQGSVLHLAPTPGSYRVEVSFPGSALPWIVSNPIRIVGEGDGASGGGPAIDQAPEVWNAIEPSATDWAVEKSPTSSGELSEDDRTVRLGFALGGGEPSGQYAALAAPVRDTNGVRRIDFVARSDRPRRISVQIRLPGHRGERWRHSVYLDETPRRLSLMLQDFEPAESGTSLRPNVALVQDLLFVVDTVNTLPGTDGEIAISEIRLGR
jgi:hypothetical protein